MEGYTLLEYIESDGTQYIDTGFKPNQDTKVVLDFYSSGASSYKCICGARIKNGNDCFAFWIKDDIAHPQIADNLYDKYSFNVSTKQRIIYIIDKNVATFGTSSVTMDSSTFQSQYNLYLFNCNQAGTAASDYFVKGKLYSCRIYDNGTLVRDYTPVMNSGGVYGLYDKVNGVFYSSATSTGFTGKAMGDNGLPVGYSECEYVESNGSQYVDTGVGAVYNMELDIQFFARSNRSLMGNSTEAGCYFGMTIDGKYELGTVVSSHSGLERRTISVESTSSAMNLTAEGETITRAKSTMPTENLKLFGGNADSSLNKYMCSARVFGCQIYVGNEMVRDFVPCCSDAGVYGLYDKVNNKFYSSATDYGFTGKWAEDKKLLVSPSEFRKRLMMLAVTDKKPDYSKLRGVFIEDIDGGLYTQNEWDGSKTPNGIAVITENCQFVMALQNAHTSYCQWGSFGTEVTGVLTTTDGSTAKTDYRGNENTTAILNQLGNSSSTSDAPAAYYCRAFTFPNGKKGYLGSAGEWQAALNNKNAIVSALSKCGGTAMSDYYWTSTQYSSSRCWYMGWYVEDLRISTKSSDRYVRAFAALKYDSGGDDVVTISFTIDGVSYKAEEGMTWEQWVNSSYNTDGFIVKSNNIYKGSSYVRIDRGPYTDIVQKSDIIEGLSYELG